MIARRLEVSEGTIRTDLRNAPAPLRPSPVPRPWAGDWRPEAERLRASGHPDHRTSAPMPHWMIAERLSVSEQDIRRHFARRRRRDARAAEAGRLRGDGLSNRAIARALGVTEATIRRDLASTPVRHPGAQKLSSIPSSAPISARANDAPRTNVLPLRRIAR